MTELRYLQLPSSLQVAATPPEVADRAGAGSELAGRIVPYNEIITVAGAREAIQPGAFDDSIEQHGEAVRLYVGHSTATRTPVGIARWYQSRADGLHAGFAIPDTQEATDMLELVRTGVLAGLSIGFIQDRHRWETVGGEAVQVVTRALLDHVAVTAGNPAYPSAQITSITA